MIPRESSITRVIDAPAGDGWGASVPGHTRGIKTAELVLGGGSRTVEEWLGREIADRDIEELKHDNVERFLRIADILDELRVEGRLRTNQPR